MHRSVGYAPRARLPFMVRTLRGLENIARAEVEALLGPTPVTVEHRALRFALPGPDPRLLALGTVDDAFLVLGEAGGIDHRRNSLRALAALAAAIDEAHVLAAVESLRRIARPVAFDVTASFVGRRNYSRFDIEDHVGRAVAAATGWAWRPRPTPLSLRVHVLHDAATLSVRLAQRPLHRRSYRIASRPGALHPPLARALAAVAAPAPGHVLVDPTCGVGTIAIEAALLEPRVEAVAFDLEPAAVRAARANAARAGVAARLRVADAARLPLRPHSADRVVVNPPWDRAVAAGGGLRRRPRALWIELARVLTPGGRLVALLPAAGADGLGRAGLDARVVAGVRAAGVEVVIVAAG
jgi:tRNA (guanine6-N2)-methyltransferase